MSPIQLCSVAFALAALLIWLRARGLRRSSRGPTVWPLVGYLPSLAFHFEHLHDWYAHLLNLNGGTVRLLGPWKCRILTGDPANIEYVTKTKYHNFVKGEYFRDIFSDIFGESFLGQDAERFRQLNKSISMALASTGFCDMASLVIPTAVHQKLLPLLRRACEKRTVIDLQDIFLRLAFDIVCVVGFGIDPASFSSDLHLPRVPYLEAYEEAIEATMLRTLMPAFCWKAMRYFNLGRERRLKRALRIMYGYADDIMARVPVDAGTCSTLLAPAFLRFERENGREYPEEALRPWVVALILAGKDSVASALTWFFWVVTQHPHVETEILAEIQEIVSQRTDQDSHNPHDPAALRLEEVKQMHYLHAALTESLRLFPPVPLEVAEAAEDDVLPDGTAVEKGSQVQYSIYATGRLRNVWGEDCLEFKPARWLKNGRFVKQSDFKYPVFNAGPRSCVGREFAYWQMKWVAASIISRYQVKMVDKHPVAPKYSTSLSIKHGLPVIIQPRVEGCTDREL